MATFVLYLKARVIPFTCFLDDGFLGFASGATLADLLVASVADEPV